MIQKVNFLMTRIFDIVLYPFSIIGEIWGILFLSILMSFVVLWVYKWVSSPASIRVTKDRIKANILAIRLYKDSGKVIVLSFLRSLAYTFKYFALNFGPVLLIVPILFPAFVQMDIRYGVKPFDVGDEIVVKAAFNQALHGLDIELLQDQSPYFKPKMNPVYIKALNEISWKLEALKPGVTAIKVKVNGRIYEKALWIGQTREALSNLKLNGSSFDHFMNPAEGLFPETGEVKFISVAHPVKEIPIAGFRIHWLILNLILVVIVVLVFKNRFGIEF